jgi:Tfp pilus assembly protein PilN
MSNKYKTVLLITDTDIKILQAKAQRGGAEPFYSFVKARAHPSPEFLQSALREGLPASLKRIGQVVLLISRRQVLMLPARFPSHSGAEIQRMVDLQVSHLTPFAREEIVICHSVVDREPDGYARVLIQAAPQDLVLSYLRLLAGRNVPCHQVILSSVGVGAWYRKNVLAPGEDAGRVVAILDVDRRGSELCFLRDDTLLFSRYLPFGHEEESPEAMSSLAEQVLLTVEAYRRECMGGPISRCIIMSDADLSRVKDLINGLDIAPAVDLVSVRQRTLGKMRKPPAGLLAEPVSWTALLGALSDGLPKEANLLPGEIIRIKSSTLKRRARIRFVAVLLGTLGVLWGALNLDNFQKERKLAHLKDALQAQEVSVRKAQENIEAIEALQVKLRSRVVLVDILRGLYEKVPEPISLRSLQLDHKGTVILQGFGESRSAVNQFHNNLVSSAMFQNVALEYATERKQYKEEYVEFKILCQLSRDEKKRAEP